MNVLAKQPPTTIGFKRAIEHMRKPGTRLVQMCSERAQGGLCFYVVPGGQVDPGVAEKIKKHPLVRGGKDGLFPGHDQTWRMDFGND